MSLSYALKVSKIPFLGPSEQGSFSLDMISRIDVGLHMTIEYLVSCLIDFIDSCLV